MNPRPLHVRYCHMRVHLITTTLRGPNVVAAQTAWPTSHSNTSTVPEPWLRGCPSFNGASYRGLRGLGVGKVIPSRSLFTSGAGCLALWKHWAITCRMANGSGSLLCIQRARLCDKSLLLVGKLSPECRISIYGVKQPVTRRLPTAGHYCHLPRILRC